MNKRLHHVGVVVPNLEKASAFYLQQMGASVQQGPVDDPIQKVRVMFLNTGTDVLLELVQPTAPDSPAQRLAEAGGGLHHMCYEVADLTATLKESRLAGSLIICNPVPATAFNGRHIAFTFTSDKVVIEYLEKELSRS